MSDGDRLTLGVVTKAGAPPGRLTGVNLLRTIGVFAVVYSHISYYFIDGMGTGWWFIDAVYRVFIQGLRLNQHLSFFGVALFLVLTGTLITGSAVRHRPGVFLFNRIGRLLPLFWFSIAQAVALVWLGVNDLFTGGHNLTGTQAALSFVLGGFFLRPEVDVLGVVWTLVVQIAFYVFCVAARPLLRRFPGVVPLLGAALCMAVICYDRLMPGQALPIVVKLVGTLPAAFIGMVIYLAWSRTVTTAWVVAGALAQLATVAAATGLGGYWSGGQHYVSTVVVVGTLVVMLGRWDGPATKSAVVHWIGTRSYPIYLLHTLLLYKTYQLTVGTLGKTGAVLAFLAATALVSEAAYRWIEVPASRWISDRVARLRAREAKSGPAAVAAGEPAYAGSR
ncbi:MAG: acyltransferase [Mycobacteriaceae bacterium]|nr:acyltransferase [Mycobacteriaceae bacterium]